MFKGKEEGNTYYGIIIPWVPGKGSLCKSRVEKQSGKQKRGKVDQMKEEKDTTVFVIIIVYKTLCVKHLWYVISLYYLINYFNFAHEEIV